MKHLIVNATTGESAETTLTDEEITELQAVNIAAGWKSLRFERNRRLAASDWTQANDSPADKYAWAEYRQHLRDLPANTTDPFNPVWPTPPS